MLEEEYDLDYFKSQGLERKICTECGSAFWTRDPEKTVCGDAPCVTYSFIGKPVFREHSIEEMRESFLTFFEKNIKFFYWILSFHFNEIVFFDRKSFL